MQKEITVINCDKLNHQKNGRKRRELQTKSAQQFLLKMNEECVAGGR
jgi:hypothetical protein